MNILIIGLGSIGSEIAYTFYSSSNITCIDHGKHFESIKKFLPKINYVKGDIHDPSLIENLSDPPDIVFYCIDTGSVVSCMNDPDKYEKINVPLFHIFLDNLYKKFNPHFFLLSSTFVYPDVDKISEKTKPFPETLYGKLRLKQEKILQEYASNYTILRLSNIFGYGNFYNIGNPGAIEKFIDCVFSLKNITVHGNGKQLVDYLHKSDLMNLLKILVQITPKTIYNVSSGNSKPIIDIAKIISKIGLEKFNQKIETSVMSNTKLPNSPKTAPNKIMNDYNWSPTLDLESIILKMMKIYPQKFSN
jgi:nucleoside-diphosphate-sugar epimerase